MTTVKDIMTAEPVTIRANRPIAEAVRLLKQAAASFLPVVDEKGMLKGVVTEGDLVRLASQISDLELGDVETVVGSIPRFYGASKDELRVLPVSEIMSRDADAVTPDTQLSDVATELYRNNRKGFPVVEHGRVVGIVTRMALIEAML